METIWIIGAGRFGTQALNRLSIKHKDRRFVVVDPVRKHPTTAQKDADITWVTSDGVRFLTDHLSPEADVSWIIPCLPIHLAWEWCRMKKGPERLVRIRLPEKLDALLPNPMRGADNTLYVSNADFMCPADCSEPAEVCTVTKQPRKQDLFARLEALHYKDYTPIVLRSRQLGPGIGGYRPAALFSVLKKIEQHKGPLLICTACRCHGVITGVKKNVLSKNTLLGPRVHSNQ